jgi:hypothetical protein
MAIPVVLAAAGKYVAARAATDENFRKSVLKTMHNILEKSPSRIREELEKQGFAGFTLSRNKNSETVSAEAAGDHRDRSPDALSLRSQLLMAAASGNVSAVNTLLSTTPSDRLSLALSSRDDRAQLLSHLSGHGMESAVKNILGRQGFSVEPRDLDRAYQVAQENDQQGVMKVIKGPGEDSYQDDTSRVMSDMTRSTGKRGRYLSAGKLWEEHIGPNVDNEAAEIRSLNEMVASTGLMEKLRLEGDLSQGVSGMAAALPVTGLSTQTLAILRNVRGNLLDGVASIQEHAAAGSDSQALADTQKQSRRMQDMEPSLS